VIRPLLFEYREEPDEAVRNSLGNDFVVVDATRTPFALALSMIS